jgi:NAD(P)-dependent dehydrogenase (short-subunit alcohol dehydrogenase family)
MRELEGKVAVITGAGSGMARATARVFVREGAKVLGVDISGREEETANELGDAFVPFHADVSNEGDVEAMFAAAAGAFERVDIVLNVAGIAGQPQGVGDLTLDAFERVIAVNLRGVVLGTKHAIKAMLPTGGGIIVNWSSTAGFNAARMPVSAYSVAKAGVIAITKAAAVEYGAQGIRANAICPGLIVTEMSGGPEAVKRHPELVENSALKRPGQPEEVGELACFLASDRATFITGAVIPIDGGQTAILA